MSVDMVTMKEDTITIESPVRRVLSWSQREEPKPLSLIYQNTDDDDNPPSEAGIVFDHGWRSFPVGTGDTVGVYLGNQLVLIAPGVAGDYL